MNDIDDEQITEGLRREMEELIDSVTSETTDHADTPTETTMWGLTSFIDQDDEQHAPGIDEFIASLDALADRALNPTFQDTVDDLMGEVRDLIVDRQRTYGPSNIQQQGIFGIINRIGNDKLARIRQRLQGRIENGEILLDDIELGSVDQPGIINDLADVIGYAVCGMLLLRGEWGMPLAEEGE